MADCAHERFYLGSPNLGKKREGLIVQVLKGLLDHVDYRLICVLLRAYMSVSFCNQAHPGYVCSGREEPGAKGYTLSSSGRGMHITASMVPRSGWAPALKFEGFASS